LRKEKKPRSRKEENTEAVSREKASSSELTSGIVDFTRERDGGETNAVKNEELRGVHETTRSVAKRGRARGVKA